MQGNRANPNPSCYSALLVENDILSSKAHRKKIILLRPKNAIWSITKNFSIIETTLKSVFSVILKEVKNIKL